MHLLFQSWVSFETDLKSLFEADVKQWGVNDDFDGSCFPSEDLALYNNGSEIKHNR